MEAPLVGLVSGGEGPTACDTPSPATASATSPSLGSHRLCLVDAAGPEAEAASCGQWRAADKADSGSRIARTRDSPNVGTRRRTVPEESYDQVKKKKIPQRRGSNGYRSAGGESVVELPPAEEISEDKSVVGSETKKKPKTKTKKGSKSKTAKKKKKPKSAGRLAEPTETEGTASPIDELRRGLLDLQPQASDEHVRVPYQREQTRKEKKKKKAKTKSKEKGSETKKTKKTKKKKKSPKIVAEEEEDNDNDGLPPTIYVDCIVVEARDLQIPVSTGWGIFGGGGPTIPSLYCAVQLGSGTQEFRTWSAEERAPIWNAGLTFTYRRTIDAALAEEDDLPMTIADNALLILTVRNRAGRLFPQELSLGEAYVVLETLEDEQVHDVWLPLRPPAKSWSLETLLQPPPEPPLGQLHIILQKILKPEAGLLAYYGTPSRAIPLRVQPGDVVLFSNTELVRHTIKIVQGSEWDHIGLVVPRPGQSGVFLLEAIVDGVRIFRLDHRLDFYRETAKIAIRRLEVHRTPEMLEALSDFAQEIQGKPYCSLLDILKTYGTGLVAAAFQRMGILAAQPPAWTYLPGDFVADNQPSYTHNPPPDAAPLTPPKLQLLQGRLSDILISPMKGIPVGL